MAEGYLVGSMITNKQEYISPKIYTKRNTVVQHLKKNKTCRRAYSKTRTTLDKRHTMKTNKTKSQH